MAIFARLAAVLVGLANLAVLVGLEADSFFWWTNLAWTEALPSVLLVVATSEIVLRKLGPLRESFSDRYGIVV